MIVEREELIIKYSESAERLLAILAPFDAKVEFLFGGYAIVQISPEQIPLLYENPGIEHMERPRRLSLLRSRASSSSCVPRGPMPGRWDVDGGGVLVGIIDSGIDYTHPDFRTDEGKSRIRALWDQSAVSEKPPTGFLQGEEYGQTLLDAALASDAPQTVVPQRDEDGHGTAVAGIAAGNTSAAGGVAPGAELLVVKLNDSGGMTKTTDLMRAVQYVVVRARGWQKPIAINLSLGMNDGSHRGDSLFETYLDVAATQWKVSLVTPTGNEGAAGHHASYRIASYAEQSIPFFLSGGLSRFFVTLWKNFTDEMEFALVAPDGGISGRVSPENPRVSLARTEGTVFLSYGQPSHYSIQQEVFFEAQFEDIAEMAGLWQIKVYSRRIVDGAFSLWLPTIEQVGEESFFSESKTENTLTIPSTAARVIAVGAYDAETGAGLRFSGQGGSPEKPDLVAPGKDILTSRVGGGYDSFTGTSMSAPFVTGAAALLMQWGIVQGNDPYLFGERLKAFLRIGARRSEGRSYPNPVWGYGTLCVEESLRELRRYQLGGRAFRWDRR